MNILSANFSTAHLESLDILDIAEKMLKYYFTECVYYPACAPIAACMS